MWVTNSGKNIHLKSSPLTKVCDIERLMLEKLAQEKLQQLGISLTPAPPAESSSSVAKQTKRKVLLLKRKAVTTGIFESKSKDDCSSKGETRKNKKENLIAMRVRHKRSGKEEIFFSFFLLARAFFLFFAYDGNSMKKTQRGLSKYLFSQEALFSICRSSNA